MMAAGIVALSLVLGGCGSDPEEDTSDRDVLEQSREVVLAETTDLAGILMAEFDVEVAGAHRAAYVECGIEIPSGAAFRSKVQLGTVLREVAAARRTATLLEDAGWTATRPGHPAAVQGEKDGLSVSVHFGPAATDLTIGSECVDTSADLARDLGARSPEDLDLGR